MEKNGENIFLRLPRGKQISFIREHKNALQIGLIRKKISKIKEEKSK